MKKRKSYRPVVRGIAIVLCLIAVAVLASGYRAARDTGYGNEIWKAAREDTDYIESAEFQQEASRSIQSAVAVIARSTRLETNGAYDENRIVCVSEYLEDGTVYDSQEEVSRANGLCYRLGDLYQWSLQGATISNDVLNEAYKPLFYGSVQEYANEQDEEYNVVVNQIVNAMEAVKSDISLYEQEQKTWNDEATNVRYALLDLVDGKIYTNVSGIQDGSVTTDQFEAYFKGFESYYIFDSRSSSVAQMNVGEYYSYNTGQLLEDNQAHLEGEYLVYIGIDTSFPVQDVFWEGSQAYEEMKATLSAYMTPMIVSACVFLLAALYLIVSLISICRRGATLLLDNLNLVLRICVYFVGYEFVQALIRLLFGSGSAVRIILILFKLAVLGALIWEGIQRQRLLTGVRAMADGEGETEIPTQGLYRENIQMAEAVNDLGRGLRTALQEQMKSERMKADLITNVSHDLKTPLTSIINYVDLLKREKLDNPKAQEYLEVLDQKSQRLKQLTEDLVEASRASSGNVTLNIERIDLREVLMQTSGEFEERFHARGLKLVADYPEEPLFVEADGRRVWRIVENLYRNVEKYAMPNTRVYLNVERNGGMAEMSMKNISEQPLNISADELMERFVRGDESRSTEGSGLGLSIAKDLTELQKGTFNIYLDGDLFKVTVAFPCVEENEA